MLTKDQEFGRRLFQIESRVDKIESRDFWKKLYDDLELNSKFNDLEDRVYNEVESKLFNFERNHRTDIDDRVPSAVAKEINTQMPSYLNQNSHMQSILNDHARFLQDSLYQTGSAYLTKLTSDPHYHVINQQYFDSFNNKGDKEIAKKKEEFDQAMNDKMHTLEDNLKLVTQLISENERLETQIKELESNLFIWHGITCFCFLFSLVGTITYIKNIEPIDN